MNEIPDTEFSPHSGHRNHALEALRDRFGELFPQDIEPLLRLCTLEDSTVLGFDHIDIWAETLDARMEETVHEDLRIGYVLLSAYYFLLDAVTDGHVAEPDDPLYLSHLLTGTHILWHRACLQTAPDKVREFQEFFLKHTTANADAVRLETKLCASPLDVNPELDRRNIVGRSDSAFLLYHVLCIVARKEPDHDIEKLLSDFVYFIQLGDDLNDWRNDYALQRWTSLLRTCFSRHGRILSEQEIEDEVYLQGLFEERLAVMINGYMEIQLRLDQLQLSCHQFRQWVRCEHDRAHKVLTEAVAFKLT